MLSLCVLLYVCESLCLFLYVCEIIVVVCVTEAAGGGARDTESKTRTPHKDVGKKPKFFPPK